MRKILLSIFLLLCVAVTYFVWPQLPPEKVLSGPFQKGEGHLWIASIPEYYSISDKVGATSASPLVLYENNVAIGKPQSLHDAIRAQGKGLYSHWDNSLYFSTSDNTDPTINGRTYTVRLPEFSYKDRVYDYLPVAIYGLFIGLVVLQVAISTFMFIRNRKDDFWPLPVMSFSIIIILHANFIDVSMLWGRAIYATLLFFLVFLFIASLYIIAKSKIIWPLRLIASVWVIFALSLLMIETAMRTVPIYTSLAGNPGIKFFWPDWVYHKLNNYGYRDRDFSETKSPRTFRILMLGDSYTEGAGLLREDTFSRLAEKALNRRFENRVNFEIYNLGQSGLNTREEVDILLRKGASLNPDMVFIGYVANDSETHPLTIGKFETPEWYAKLQNIFITRLGSYAFYALSTTVSFAPSEYKSTAEYHAAQHNPQERGWKDVLSALQDMRGWLNENNVEGVALLWPIFSNGWSTDAKTLNEQVIQALSMHGLTVHDLNVFFAQTGQPLSKFALSPFDPHPNAEANKKVAVLIEDIVLKSPQFQKFLTRVGATQPPKP